MLPGTLINYKILKNKENIIWDKIGNSGPNDDPKYDIFSLVSKLPYLELN